MKEKVVLAYSGGLDTTALIPWLKETFDYEVICCCVNCGQGERTGRIWMKELNFPELPNYISKISLMISATITSCHAYRQVLYMNTNICSVLLWHVLVIAKKLVEIARKENAVAICHGATGKGNDQIRFELGIKALAPDIKIIAPWRMTDVWTMQSRDDEIAYCKAHGINLPFCMQSHSYSRDRNLWHISHEGLELEDPSQAPNYDHLLVLGVSPEKAPDEAQNM